MDMRLHRLLRTAAMAAAMVAGFAVGASGLEVEVQIDEAKAATVKAAYLLNFVRYSQWPDATFERPDSPIRVTQIGECSVGNVLSSVVERAGPVGGHPILLRNVPAPDLASDQESFLESLERPHVLFVCSMTPAEVEAILQHCKGTHVLTIGDAENFADSGGMLGFVLERDRILFEANPKAIQDSKVSVSAKVLKLAQIVGEGKGQ